MKPLGNSGFETGPLVLGGNVFGWTADQAASFAILDRFVERGGTVIDSADIYSAWVPGHSGGESETVLGEWIKQRGGTDGIVIATKVGLLHGDGGSKLKPEFIASSVEASLNRLQVDCIDLYYAHRDDFDTPIDEVLSAFSELVDAGKVKAIAASNYTADRLAEALAISDAKGLPRYSVIQPQFNLLDRDDYVSGLQELAIKEGLGVVPYFALASGYLTGKYRSKDDVSGDRGGMVSHYLDGKGPAVLAVMDKVAAETGASLAQIALAWSAAQPGITAPIASATSVEQLDEIMDSFDLTLSEDQLAMLTDAV